jgi:hypothetical protein
VRDGYCRLCWQQARYEAQLAGGRKRGAVAILASAGRLERHQLFFDRMKGRRAASPVRRYDRRGAPRQPAPAPAVRPGVGWTQPGLFESRRDFARFSEGDD